MCHWDFNGFSLGNSWFHYSRTERCFSSVWESRLLWEVQSFGRAASVVAGLVKVCETNANILEGSSAGTSLRPGGPWLPLHRLTDFTGSLSLELSTKRAAPRFSKIKLLMYSDSLKGPNYKSDFYKSTYKAKWLKTWVLESYCLYSTLFAVCYLCR